MRHAIKGLAVALFASGAAGFGYLPDGYDSLDNPGGYGYESFAGYCAIDGNDAGLGEGDEGRTDYADVSVSACATMCEESTDCTAFMFFPDISGPGYCAIFTVEGINGAEYDESSDVLCYI